MKSKRADGRGHWPKGRRLHKLSATQAAAVAEARSLLARRHVRGRISKRALAAYVGVHEASVRRWFSGQDIPAPERARKVGDWVSEIRADVA